MTTRSRLLPALALPLSLALAACGSGDAGADDEAGGGSGGGESSLTVITAFYPLEFIAERVAGEHAEISTLTAPGVDPHDLELSPKTVASLGSADLVVYSAGMQPAVDQAVDTQAPQHALNVDGSAELSATGEGGHDDEGHGHEDHEHGDEGHEGHDHGPEDPHFWLDPHRYGLVAKAVAEELAEIDPDHAEDYRANAEGLVGELDDLDAAFSEGLASCSNRTVVTAHEAFGYLADRYDLDQTGITGISPESEPSPARLAQISQQVRELGVETVYTEPLLDDGIAETVANETGAKVLVLDPVEAITDRSAGENYLEVMESNLDALREGLGCS